MHERRFREGRGLSSQPGEARPEYEVGFFRRESLTASLPSGHVWFSGDPGYVEFEKTGKHHGLPVVVTKARPEFEAPGSIPVSDNKFNHLASNEAEGNPNQEYRGLHPQKRPELTELMCRTVLGKTQALLEIWKFPRPFFPTGSPKEDHDTI